MGVFTYNSTSSLQELRSEQKIQICPEINKANAKFYMGSFLFHVKKMHLWQRRRQVAAGDGARQRWRPEQRTSFQTFCFSKKKTTIIPCLSYDRSPFQNPFQFVQSSGPVIIQARNYNKGTHYFRKRSKLCHGGANAWLQVVCWEHHGASAEAPAQIGL